MWELRYSKTFSAAHQLPGYDGPCGRLHGHDWKVEIVLRWQRKPPLDESGISVDFNELKRLTHEEFDHQLLNKFMSKPSAENIVSYILQSLRESQAVRRTQPHEIEVVVWESPHSSIRAVERYEAI